MSVLSLGFSCALCAAPIFSQSGLLVSSRNSDAILLYDQSGEFVRVFASGNGLNNPIGMAFSPEGTLVVASANSNQILEFDGTTGAFIRVLASGLPSLRNLNYGPDGNLYACRGDINAIVKIDSQSGQSSVFATSPAAARPTSFTFGPDFSLYVGSVTKSQVVKFDGETGAFLKRWATENQNGTHDLSFGPDGDLYVSNAFGTLSVARFDGITGAQKGIFVQDPTLSFPLGLTWDRAGDLYIANQGGNDVRKYDGTTGVAKGAFISPGSGGLNGPLFAIWTPEPTLTFTPPSTGVGVDGHFSLSGARSGGIAVIAFGFSAGNLPLPWPNLSLGINNPLVLGFGPTDESGQLVIRIPVPVGIQGTELLFQSVDLTGFAVGSVVRHTF